MRVVCELCVVVVVVVVVVRFGQIWRPAISEEFFNWWKYVEPMITKAIIFERIHHKASQGLSGTRDTKVSKGSNFSQQKRINDEF